MKVGRNAPCPCGSGRKYKKCCLQKETPDFRDLDYRRLSKAYDRLMNRLMDLVPRVFGAAALYWALDEFYLWPDSEDDPSDEAIERNSPVFTPWLVFHWTYEPEEDDVEPLSGPEGLTAAELYAEERGGRLDPLEQSLIEVFNRRPFTFLEILRVDRGRGLRVRDVLTGAELEVMERAATEVVQPGDLIYGMAGEVNGVGMLVGVGTTLIPPSRKPQVIDLRRDVRQSGRAVTEDLLSDWEEEIRGLYLHIQESLHTLPQICNTDGDPLELHRLDYEIDAPDEAFERLWDLCTTCGYDELRADAGKDPEGLVTKVDIHWDRQGHKQSESLPNTLLGTLKIRDRRLTVEVNSAERAEKIQKEIENRLGKGARLRADVIQSTDSMLEQGPLPRKGSGLQEKVLQDPDVREQIVETLAGHWEGWIHEELPALGGVTPAEAVKTADGREAVEALLRDAERDRSGDPLTHEANRRGARRARELLGL